MTTGDARDPTAAVAATEKAAKTAAIGAVYRQVHAPGYAAPNLDALIDVLRDLSWLPPGEVAIELPDLGRLDHADRRALLHALATAVEESSGSVRPLRVRRRAV